MVQLVKDYIEDRIVFYWQNKHAKRISPTFPCLQHAKEWLVDWYFCAYRGPERRYSKIDRRNLSTGQFSAKRNPYTLGRRITDREVKAEINLADEKIEELIQQNLTDHTDD